MESIDWSRPQRQPVAGLVVVFLNTFWEAIKRLWLVVLLSILGRGDGKNSKRWIIVSLIILVAVAIGAVLRWLYFRFYIEDDKLIVKSGWLRKQTTVVPLERIQTVDVEQGPLHQLLGIVKLSVDTAGSQKAEVKIDALRKPMAEALRAKLLSERRTVVDADAPVLEKPQPIIRLGAKDLLKLSLSANHLETFFLFLSFAYGIYENLNDVDEDLFAGASDRLPGNDSLYPIVVFAAAILLITILISTGRIFFKFYHFTVFRTAKGFQIKGGLLNVKERLVAVNKIQFVSWKQSWLRRLVGMWMLEQHVTGANEIKQKLRVQVPITQAGFIAALVDDYHPIPEVAEADALQMHPSFVVRRTLMQGLLPSLILAAVFWFLISWYSLLFFLFAILVWLMAWLAQRKFRAWAMDDAVYIHKGIFGSELLLLQWHKLQSVQLKQSMYQRRAGLASLVVFTAGGRVNIPFISLQTARALMNMALYKTEAEGKAWN